MKTIVWILMVVMGVLTTKADASDSRTKDDSDSAAATAIASSGVIS